MNSMVQETKGLASPIIKFVIRYKHFMFQREKLHTPVFRIKFAPSL